MPNDVVIYDDAGHAFFDDQRASYVASAAEDAWQRERCVFREVSGAADAVTIAVIADAFSSAAPIGAAIAWLAARAENAALRAPLEQSTYAFRERRSKSLLERAKNDLREATATRASERVGELVSPVAQKLGEFDRLLGELLGRTDKLESATVKLTTQTSTLVTALRNPASRGKWGEMQLRNVVEKAGMLPHCDFFEQQTVALEEARVRPDMTINLPGERCVFVDAKAPIDSMQAALEAPDDETRKALVKQHARALRDHVDALARRGYQTAKGSADYVVMFVAGEAFLSSACSEDPSLIEYALDKGVLVTGPLTLISLLRTFAMGWQALRQEENAKRIATHRASALRAHAQVRRPPPGDAQASRALGQRVQRCGRLVRDEASTAGTQAQRRSGARRRRARRDSADRRRAARRHGARHRRDAETPSALAASVPRRRM